MPLRENEGTFSKMDVKSLSDRDLKEQLVKHGVLPGPILPTTRFVYEKKLQQLLDQGPPVPRERQNGNGDMDRYSDSDEEDPRDSTAEQRREVPFTAVPNNASIFNHSKQKCAVLTVVVPVPSHSSLYLQKHSDYASSSHTSFQDTPFRATPESSKPNVESESSFSVTRMVEQMDQRPPMGHTGGHQKMLGSSSRNSYNVKDPLMVDKNTMTYRMPTNTPKACVFLKQNRFQAGDLLQMDDTAEQYSPSTYSALGMSATRRKPIKGAAGRPIHFKYDDLVTQARLVEQSKLESGKGSARKRVPVYLQVAMFAAIAFFVLVFLTMENNPENPFHPYVEKQEVQLPH